MARDPLPRRHVVLRRGLGSKQGIAQENVRRLRQTRFGYDDWQREAYEELVYRPDSLSINEAMWIGLEAATHIARIRELRLNMMPRTEAASAYREKRYAVYVAHGSSRTTACERRPFVYQPYRDDFRTYAAKKATDLQTSRIREEISKLIYL